MKLSQKLVVAFLLVGLVPVIVSSLLSLNRSNNELEQQVFDKLSAVRSLKAHEIQSYFEANVANVDTLTETVRVWEKEELAKLSGLLDVKKNEVERYFQTIEGQVLTFSQNTMVVDAMSEFSANFKDYSAQIQLDPASVGAMRSDLKAYYSNEFGAKYSNELGKAAPIDAMLSGLSDTTIALQHAYIAANPHPLGAKEELDQGSLDTAYDALHEEVHPVVRNYLRQFGYYDIFLVEPDSGHIVYSVYKELDYATSLNDGPYAETNFAKAFRAANALTSPGEFVLVDYESYTPSYEAPASFIASPIFKDGKKLGVAVFQMPIDRLNAIMSSRAGMGETGKSYLVGPDLLMRSDSDQLSVLSSFLDPENGSVNTTPVRRALEGEVGADMAIDRSGNYVLSAYAPVHVANHTWSILVEVDVTEAMNPKMPNGHEYFADFIELNGYYDLFLIDSEGYCFYSVAKEADYKTNFINGPYAKSGLGRLVQKVLSTKNYAFVDYSPYAPSNGDAAAFAAKPVMHGDEVKMIVAVQLSAEKLNEIVKERTGMGETGDSYLVGPDFRMRSDSFLDPENRSIQASFAGSVAENGVQTEQVKAALAGKTDTVIGEDYRGASVLSAYGPIQVGNLTWAIVSEMTEAEAFAAVNDLRVTALIVAVVCMVLVLLVALYVSRMVSQPIMLAVAQMQIASKETGSAASEVSSASQLLADGASEQAASLEETGSAINEIHSIIQTGAQQAQQTNETAQSASASANAGQAAMADLRTQVDAVVGSAKEMEVAMAEIQESSASISKIIKTIDEIAFQTNILALNAAVEAARAGEAGAGFAVVADEVRSLAGRASEAARQTSALIEDSVARSQHGVTVNEAVGVNLQQVLEKASQVDQGFNKITEEVNMVATTMHEFESSSRDQSEGIEQINAAMVQVSDVTQQNAASAEEAASASEELNAQALSLTEIVSALSAVVYGKGGKNSGPTTSDASYAPSDSYRLTDKKQEPMSFDM